MDIQRGFGSDNQGGIHPEVLTAIQDANIGHAGAYGDDMWTDKARHLFRQKFDAVVDTYFVANGTGANVLVAASLCHSYEAVITTDSAHLNSDECGAPEKNTGCKILTSPHKNGKLTPEGVLTHLRGPTDQHWVKPKMISVTQSTECGTVYTSDELAALGNVAREHNLYFHVDGARISNAVVHLDTTLNDMLVKTGVDVVSFGGTKNGLLMGEAVVFINRDLGKSFPYIRKQGMQLLSKMRFLSSQFIAFFENDLWLRNAHTANKMARFLGDKLAAIPDVEILYPIESNEVFLQVPKEVTKLADKWGFYTWDQDQNVIRLVTSFDTTESDIIDLMTDIIAL